MAFALPSDILDACTGGLLYCLGIWANSVTNNLFWIMVIAAFGVVIFLATQHFGSTRAFGFAGFGISIASIFLAFMNLITWWATTGFLIIALAGLFGMILSERN